MTEKSQLLLIIQARTAAHEILDSLDEEKPFWPDARRFAIKILEAAEEGDLHTRLAYAKTRFIVKAT